ncbi:MAG: hypothetical protein R2750_13465 [Bacteroidales bacterium]
MKKLLLVIFSIFFVLSACKKQEQEPEFINHPNYLLGSWVYTNIDNEVQIMRKLDNLIPDRYGFSVLPNGLFVERRNTGECGTGGNFIFKDNQGEWQRPEAFVYKVQVPFNETLLKYNILIDFVNNDSLRFRYDYSPN